MAKSKVYLRFDSVPIRYSSIGIRFNNNPTNNTIYEQFQYLRVTPTGTTIKYAVKEGADVFEAAKNYHDAVKADQSIDNPGKFNFGYTGNVVWIEAVESCVQFEITLGTNPAIGLEFHNENCDVPPMELVSQEFLNAPANPCEQIFFKIETTNPFAEITSPPTVGTIPNPYVFEIERGIGNLLLEGTDANGQVFSQTFPVPGKLDPNGILIEMVNTASGSNVTINSDYPLLNLQYKIDDTGEWQTLNKFFLELDNTYILYVKDQYGCEISETFYISDWYSQVPITEEVKRCGNLHELNVGKYLNLFGKQHTMKIGFVCNDQISSIKIFKHIQMILNTEYSVKNIKVTTSGKQERFIPGEHMSYRIREGMHSVPLKNPNDWDDLRGSWAYLEIEIESINDTKIDLFSVVMYLRKSFI